MSHRSSLSKERESVAQLVGDWDRVLQIKGVGVAGEMPAGWGMGAAKVITPAPLCLPGWGLRI